MFGRIAEKLDGKHEQRCGFFKVITRNDGIVYIIPRKAFCFCVVYSSRINWWICHVFCSKLVNNRFGVFTYCFLIFISILAFPQLSVGASLSFEESSVDWSFAKNWAFVNSLVHPGKKTVNWTSTRSRF